MRIELKGRDYTFHITERQLIDLINNRSKLVDTLFEQEFILEYSANLRSQDEIDLSYSPENSSISNAAQIVIKTGLGVLERVRHGELVNTKYNGRNYIFICRDG